MKIFDSGGEPFIYLISKGEATVENFGEQRTKILKLIENAVEAEIALIQIREKKLSARLVFELAAEAVKLARGTGTNILVNDRADIAFAAGAGGVHLTCRSLSADVIRRSFHDDFIIGVSAHTIEQAELAKKLGADFATLSPIFDSPGKHNALGLDKLREVCEKLKPFPVIALGGIDATNYRSVSAAGASGFAAIRFLNDVENFQEIFRKDAR